MLSQLVVSGAKASASHSLWGQSNMYRHAQLLQLYLILCDPMDCGPPGSSDHGILQGRILEWAVIPSSRGSSWPRRSNPHLLCPALEDRFFITSTTWEASNRHISSSKSWLCQAYTENLVSLYIKHVSSRRQVVPRQSLLQILFEISRRNRNKITTTPWSYTQEMTWTHPNFKVPF